MLSRVADALFWMSRYVERAEHVARLLDVWFHLELDLSGVGAAPFEMHWTALCASLQQPMPSRPGVGSPSVALSHWLAFEHDKPGSVMACLSRARLNARSIRGTINSEVWRELNKLYWKLSDAEFVRRSRESPYDFYQAVECGSALFQGLCDATSTHEEGWRFIQLGKFVERADKTLRLLDVQYHLLRDLTNPADVPLSTLHWAAVLKSCRAYDSYQRPPRRPRRAGARRRISAAGAELPAFGALLPGGAGRVAGGDRGAGPRRPAAGRPPRRADARRTEIPVARPDPRRRPARLLAAPD